LLGLGLVLRPVRSAVLDRAQDVVRWSNGSWMEQLNEGELLIKEGRFAEAAAHLERLDRMHPARNVRHALNRERERLLSLLAQSYEGLDRRALAIQTYQRLVAFDPKHYRNHFELAQASERLLGRTSTGTEALDAYAAALKILPVHLPSVRGRIKYYSENSEFTHVVEEYERYLNAYLIQNAEVRVGNAVVEVPVLVDGRQRDFEIPMATTLSTNDVLTIATRGFAVAVDRVEIVPGARVGEVAKATPLSADLSNPDCLELERAERGAYRPLGAASALRLAIPGGLDAVGGVRLRMAFFKPVDHDLWVAVEKSYKNLLNETGRIAAGTRSVPFASPEAADLVISRLEWATEGELP
jgi:tetratricopeptide (TPR) repeat protein